MWTIAVFIVLIALMYFTMIRPQRNQQQKKAEMMNQLKKGDQVVMIDGLHGKIDSVNSKDKTIVLDADGIYLTFSRMAVQQIVPSASAETEPETPAAEEKTADDSKEEKPAEKESNSQTPVGDNSASSNDDSEK